MKTKEDGALNRHVTVRFLRLPTELNQLTEA